MVGDILVKDCPPHTTESPVDAVAIMMISYVQIYSLTLKMQGHLAAAAAAGSQR